MKEYNIENGEVNLDQLKTPFIPKEEYKEIHKKIIRACHDIFIEYKGGILLVVRDNFPAKNILAPIGGGIERGMKIEDSLRKKVKEECNLKLKEITELGYARTFFKTDPFGHSKGTDTLNIIFFGKGEGELKLDNLHKNPIIITSKKYTKEFRANLHPYIRDFMDIAIKLIK